MLTTLAYCCRICLKESSNMQSLTAKSCDSIEFWDMLISLTNMDQIKNFPSNICESCRSALCASYSFKKLCLETEQLLNKLQTDPISITIDQRTELKLEESGTEAPETVEDTKFDPPIIDDIKLETDEQSEEQNNSITNDDKIRQNTSPLDLVKPEISLKTRKKAGGRKEGVRCCMCSVDFSTRKEYQKHYNTIHSEKSLCMLCGKLLSRRMIDIHMVSHTKAQDYMCTECGQRFTLPENLKAHLRIHSGDKHYKCEDCGMKFIHWNSKNNHVQKVHKKEKFKCNLCSKSFTTRSNRARHLRWHKGDFRHMCPHCPMKFLEGQKLRRHLKVHVKQEEQCLTEVT